MFQRVLRLDWALVGALACLALASLLALGASSPEQFSRQVTWYVVAFALIIFGSLLNWRTLLSQAWFRYGVYGFSVTLLALAHVLPGTVRGTKSWIVIGGFQFEPSELAKFALIIVFSYFFSRHHVDAWRLKHILGSFAYLAVPIALVATFPDFGGTFILGSIWFGYLLFGGINVKRLGAGIGIGILLAGVLWVSFLKPYQKDRIIGFASPGNDPLGINYNVIQSKIAIGSAGVFGKGFQGGTQTQLHFLPEAQTDFIFSAFTEEWGIVGGSFVIAALMFVVYRVVRIGIAARDNFSKLFALGVGLFLISHFVVNVGSATGLMPVAGVTFPFLSYGGSNLLTVALLVSIMQSIKLESSA